MALAKEFGGEIVGCDALQIYRHMDIGTAKPTTADRHAVPHHMIDLRDPGEDFSAGDYQRLGRDALNQIVRQGRLPIVAGGTGFYLRALIDGLFAGPGRSEAMRVRLRRIIERRGSERLHRILLHSDPRAAARISPADGARIIRALEVIWTTGTALSKWQERPRESLAGFRWLRLGIAWPRDELYRRIDRRVEEMFEAGFAGEVRSLLSRFPRDCHAFKAIGYRQSALHLEGLLTLEEARADTQRETRRYAKRQMTWFRSDPSIIWLECRADPSELLLLASEEVRRFLADSPQPDSRSAG